MIELIGHRAVKKQLADLIINSQLGHAYIFDGIDGIGKTTAAKWFAAAALCREGKGKACGVCDSCKKINSEFYHISTLVNLKILHHIYKIDISFLCVFIYILHIF